MEASYDPEFAPTSAERIGRNDAIFRDANEAIRAVAERDADRSEPTPFLCECAEPTCREIVLLTLDEYAAVRAHPAHFLNAPRHEQGAGSAARVVEQHGTYVVVEKLGKAREVAEETAGEGALADRPPPA